MHSFFSAVPGCDHQIISDSFVLLLNYKEEEMSLYLPFRESTPFNENIFTSCSAQMIFYLWDKCGIHQCCLASEKYTYTEPETRDI